ncbi:MAG: hypothetical protein AAFN78_02090 [Pseudomonadota bacterium]
MNDATHPGPVPGNAYLNRTVLILVSIAMVGFGAFSALQGFDFAAYPLVTHFHAVSMAAWLLLLATQSILGSGGKLDLHRRLGWLGAGLAVFIVVTGIAVAFKTIMLGRLPPIFEPGYFLMLGLVNMVNFAIIVAAGIATRGNTAWHRRFMLGSILVVFEPVLGRVLPFFIVPAIGGPDNLLPFLEQHRTELEVLRIGVHLAIIGIVMLGDRLVTGRFHPVFILLLLAVTALYAIVNVVGGSAPFEAFAAGLQPTLP